MSSNELIKAYSVMSKKDYKQSGNNISNALFRLKNKKISKDGGGMWNLIKQ